MKILKYKQNSGNHFSTRTLNMYPIVDSNKMAITTTFLSFVEEKLINTKTWFTFAKECAVACSTFFTTTT